jgi:hypothetical protein
MKPNGGKKKPKAKAIREKAADRETGQAPRQWFSCLPIGKAR